MFFAATRQTCELLLAHKAEASKPTGSSSMRQCATVRSIYMFQHNPTQLSQPTVYIAQHVWEAVM